jgi:nucleotide-binding universal stress UspA family protein
MKFGKILVPLDGSILAEAALWQALEIADGGTISLLRAAEPDPVPAADSPAAQVAALREAQEYLRGMIKRLESNGMSRVEANVWYGSPAAAIVGAARTEKVDLIVMATHGRERDRVGAARYARAHSRRPPRGRAGGRPGGGQTDRRGLPCISERSSRSMDRSWPKVSSRSSWRSPGR